MYEDCFVIGWFCWAGGCDCLHRHISSPVLQHSMVEGSAAACARPRSACGVARRSSGILHSWAFLLSNGPRPACYCWGYSLHAWWWAGGRRGMLEG